MFNSLHLRDVLRAFNKSPLKKERRNPHRLIKIDPNAVMQEGEFVITGDWNISCSLGDEELEIVIREDVANFFSLIGANIRPDSEKSVTLRFDRSLAERDCRLIFAPEAIEIIGGGVAGIWAGIAWFEWEVRTRRGPFLPAGIFEHTARWPMQISQGPWGANYSVPDFSPDYLGDDGFRLYAHYGVNSMMIYGDLLCYVQSTLLPELNHADAEENLQVLASAAKRAARYGVRFSYVVVGPKLRADHPVFQKYPSVRGAGIKIDEGEPVHILCSSNELVIAFYREAFRSLFVRVPELAGLILIAYAESFYHCRIWDSHPALIKCPSCASMPPNQMVGNLFGQITHEVQNIAPSAFIAAWVYNWLGDRKRFFREIPNNITMLHHVEKDGSAHKELLTKVVWDYSIDYIGPSPEMTALAEEAHATKKALFIKTETGIGLEVIQFPYIPAMQQLARKWEGVQQLQPNGVLQSWLFFGMFGSRAEELGLWAAYTSGLSSSDFLKKMALRDFGPQAVIEVMAAWEYCSKAVTHIPCICLPYYYTGPSFLGPAHPLVPNCQDKIPEVFFAHLYYLLENEETFSVRSLEDAKVCLVMKDLPEPDAFKHSMFLHGGDIGLWEAATLEYQKAVEQSKLAWKTLESASLKVILETDKAALTEETLLTELFYRTMKACENTLRFLLARRTYEKSAAAADYALMATIARDERENATQALPIYEQIPHLDLACRTDGKFHPIAKMIKEKIRWIDRAFPYENFLPTP